jgi:hypothetical protein
MVMCRFLIWAASRKPKTEIGIAEVMISVAPGKGELKILFMMTSATVTTKMIKMPIDPMTVKTHEILFITLFGFIGLELP